MQRVLLITAALIMSGSLSAGTFGSLWWRDIDGLVAANKRFFERILGDFDIACVGDARMINRAENIKLDGARIGPYNFPAKPKGTPQPFCYELHIETRATFLDASGKPVSLREATDFREVVTSVALRPEPPDKCFTQRPDQCE
jgi:hypothetical protein